MVQLTIDRSKGYWLTEEEYRELTNDSSCSLSDIAKMWGCARSLLVAQPWRVPNNGTDCKGRRGYRYPRKVVEAWIEKGTDTLKKEWAKEKV